MHYRMSHSQGPLHRVAETSLCAIALIVTVLLAAPAAQANGSGRVLISPCLNLRAAPDGATLLIGCIPQNTTISIDCTASGNAVNGPYGTTTLWDHTSYAGKSGYVSDAWIYTGTAGAVAPGCSGSTAQSSPPPTSGRSTGRKASSNLAAFGNCTWGALEQWHLRGGYYPQLGGNAKDWAASARANGWTVVPDAQPRSIVVLQPGVWGSSSLGHVGYVTGVSNSGGARYVTFIEMNGTAGFNRWDTRTRKDIAGMSYILQP